MSHLLLAPSRRDVFDLAASPSFDLPLFLFIETIVSSRGASTPSTLFEYAKLTLFVKHPTSYY
jgi:hypothetical protein